MQKYLEISKFSQAAGEANDCTIRATAIVTGLSYEIVHKAFADAGRKKGKGCHIGVQDEAWKSLGYIPETIWVKQFKDDSKIPSLMKGHSITASQIKKNEDYFKYFGNFLIYCKNHVAAISEGKLQDWTANSTKKPFYTIVFLNKQGD